MRAEVYTPSGPALTNDGKSQEYCVTVPFTTSTHCGAFDAAAAADPVDVVAVLACGPAPAPPPAPTPPAMVVT